LIALLWGILKQINIMNKFRLKVGDKVIITSWAYAKIRTPQKGVIKKINEADFGIYIEEDHYGRAGLWWFNLGEFELDKGEEPVTKPDFEKWLDEKITNLVKLDVDAGKLIEVRRIYRLFLNID